MTDLDDLKARLATGMPVTAPEPQQYRAAKPIYLLTVDDPGERSIVLIVRTGRDGIVRATIALPEWHELPEGWDGPHEMTVAVPLADDYAHEYGYHCIAIDIESSQLWQPEWGTLQVYKENEISGR